ncbi:MAG: tolB protein precursor [Myxococcales bacterium]|nr:tolB protein precursor [Myxococcales bacterium]
MKLWLLVTAIAVAGCVEHVQLSNNGALPGLISLEIAPGETALAISDLAAPPQVVAFTATGHFVGGDTRDVTELVQWTADNPAPGTLGTTGTYATTNAAAGHVTIRATSGDIFATATVTITVSIVIVDSEFPPPANADALFGDASVVTGDPMRSPSIRYPAEDTMFPQALSRILFQYTPGNGNDAVKLTFDSDVLHVVVYSGGDRWQPDSVIWALIELSNTGSQTTFAIASTASATPGTVYAGAAETLHFSRRSIDASIDYWSDATKAVMRARLDSAVAGKLYPIGTDKTCVGCHTVSRDGRRIALGYGGETLQSVDLGSLAIQVPVTAKIPMGWATFSPTGDRLLVADRGVLTLYDAVTGAAIGPTNGRVPLGGMFATHPDWSPDGSFVLVALTTAAPTNMDLKGGSIARIPYQNGSWGSPEILVASTTNNDNNYFPKWSPDGKLIAYVHANSPAHAAPTAELLVITAAGGTPTPLRIASHRVAGTDDVPNLANTMPTWAPVTGDLAWLAFASARPYGLVRPIIGASQIWVAAIDSSRAGDPSFAAFWLPAQLIANLNNNPIWAVAPTPVN